MPKHHYEKAFLTSAMRLKAFRSGLAVTASNATLRLFQALSTILLARLLDPQDFGLVSLGGALIGICGLFSGLGMKAALIASTDETNKAAFHAFLITTTVGCLFTALIAGFASEFALIFGGNELTKICQWMAVIVLFNAIGLIPDALLSKEMMFGRRIIPAAVSSLSYMLTAVGMAYAGFGLWSLVYGRLVKSCMALLTNVLVCPTLRWLIPHKWDPFVAKNLTKFGMTTLGTGLVQYGYEHGDKLVVGKLFGTTQLGFYSQAYTISALTVGQISMITNSVLFPAYATIRDDNTRLAKAFLNSLQMLSAITIPFSMGLLILAPELIIFLIGEKWRASIPLLQIFAFLGLLRPLSGIASPLFLAINRPQYNFGGALIQGIAMIILVIIFIPWEVEGIALALVGAFAIGFIYNMFILCRNTGLPISLRDYLSQMLPTLIATVVMMAIVLCLKEPLLNMVAGAHNVFSLLSLVITGIISYGLTLYVIKPHLVTDIIELIFSGLGLGKHTPKFLVARKK
ncbi:lipopolysaccharide biosynthesis protein [Nitrospira sp. M1]